MKGLRRRQRNRKRDRRRNIECELLSRPVVLPEYVVGSRARYSNDEANEAFPRRARALTHTRTHVVYIHVPQVEPDPLSER